MREDRRFFIQALAGVGLSSVFPRVVGAQEEEPDAMPVPKNRIRAHLVYEFGTSAVLSAENENTPLNPASLTKLLPAVAFYRFKKTGLLTSDEREIARAEDHLRNALITSNNYASQYVASFLAKQKSVVAEAKRLRLIPGTEWTFGAVVADPMAREIGMETTTTRVGSGLPGYTQGVPFSVTTLRDQMKLCNHIYTEHPEIIAICSQPYYEDRGGKHFNTNRLLETSARKDALPYRGADGLKTGYIDYSGYNQITSALRDGRRIVAIEIGAASRQECIENTIMRLDAGFAALEQKYKPQIQPQPRPRIDPYAERAFV
jgi:D-alanyl-D-alanine carboxypeptidase